MLALVVPVLLGVVGVEDQQVGVLEGPLRLRLLQHRRRRPWSMVIKPRPPKRCGHC